MHSLPGLQFELKAGWGRYRLHATTSKVLLSCNAGMYIGSPPPFRRGGEGIASPSPPRCFASTRSGGVPTSKPWMRLLPCKQPLPRPAVAAARLPEDPTCDGSEETGPARYAAAPSGKPQARRREVMGRALPLPLRPRAVAAGDWRAGGGGGAAPSSPVALGPGGRRGAPTISMAEAATRVDLLSLRPSSPPLPCHCETMERLSEWGESPAISAIMFAAGVLGNATALALLVRARRRRRERRERAAPFHVLAMALVLTDLLGTCLLSPVVLAAYGRGRALVALAEGGRVCLAFAFAMSFFGLATMGCLGAMALERSLALGAPYLYERLRRRGRRADLFLPPLLGALYALAAAFCALPLLGFGRYVQYCPGTWCFMQMRRSPCEDLTPRPGDLTFSLLYASLLLLLILAVLLCNLSAIVSLVRMHRRSSPARRLPATAAASTHAVAPLPLALRGLDGKAHGGPSRAARRALSVTEELDHLILLSIVTITFAVCSLPFAIRAFENHFIKNDNYKEAYKVDLQAMRFLSINSIIDPWVFTILRPSVLRVIRSVLCCRTPLKLPTKHHSENPPISEPKTVQTLDICGQ
uniref:Prostaglandin E receptor 2 n=1 Tax=Salvator merianae TaxID=96440 RepID=A0A8D0BR79_SALMN